MTHQRDVERLLDQWFADGPDEAPDWVLAAVGARIDRQRQRPGWLATRRIPEMTAPVRLLLVAAALVGALAIGYSVLISGGGRSDPVATQAPTASPSPTATPTDPPATASAAAVTYRCADDTTSNCAGPLEAGTVTTQRFAPAFSVTLPEGYSNTFDITRTYSLVPKAHVFDLQVLSHLAIPEQNAVCSAEAKPGAGNSVDDWVEFITSHPGLVAGKPAPVAVGGFEGQRIQFHVSPDWTERCPFSLGPAVVVFTDDGTPPARSIWFDDHFVTAWILDVNGSTVIVHVDSGASLDSNDVDVRNAQPVIDSISFATGS